MEKKKDTNSSGRKQLYDSSITVLWFMKVDLLFSWKTSVIYQCHNLVWSDVLFLTHVLLREHAKHVHTIQCIKDNFKIIKLYDKCSHSNVSVPRAWVKNKDPQLNCACLGWYTLSSWILLKHLDVSVGTGTQQRNKYRRFSAVDMVGIEEVAKGKIPTPERNGKPIILPVGGSVRTWS